MQFGTCENSKHISFANRTRPCDDIALAFSQSPEKTSDVQERLRAAHRKNWRFLGKKKALGLSANGSVLALEGLQHTPASI